MRRWLLELFRVSDQPAAVPGSEGAAQVFRASPRYLGYCALSWAAKQAVALAGLLVSLAVISGLEVPFLPVENFLRFHEILRGIEIPVASGGFALAPLLSLLEALAVAGWLVQLVATGLLLRLAWEVRWYVVGEHALRLREGIWTVREQTLTLANVQNMVLRRGPLQRLFGIADLEVHAAGGGGGSAGSGQAEAIGSKPQTHSVVFRGLDDAAALRDRIRDRLARERGAGLGDDADDDADDEPSETSGRLKAVRTLAAEARALRVAAAAARMRSR